MNEEVAVIRHLTHTLSEAIATYTLTQSEGARAHARVHTHSSSFPMYVPVDSLLTLTQFSFS